MKRFWYLVSPTGFEVAIYTLLSIVLLLLGSYKLILKQLANSQHGNTPQTLQLNPSDFTGMLQAHNWTAVVSTVFFWSMVGLVLALVGWAFINTLIDLYNTYVVSTNFMHPRYFQQTAWWGDYLLHISIRIITGIAIITYVFILTRFLYPAWLGMFQKVLDRPSDPLAWILAVVSVTGLGVSIHGMIVLFRLWAMKPRILENR